MLNQYAEDEDAKSLEERFEPNNLGEGEETMTEPLVSEGDPLDLIEIEEISTKK
jgi:hypothetical protein